MAEDEMIRQQYQLSGHEFEPTPGDSGGQRSLACYSPWGCEGSDTTQRLKNNIVIAVLITALHVPFAPITPNCLLFLGNDIHILTFHYFLFEILFDKAVCHLPSSTSASPPPHPFPTGMTLALSGLHFAG